MKRVLGIMILFNLVVMVIIPILIVNLFNLFDDTHLIQIYNVKSDKMMRLELEEYIKGVVAAEMPARFEIEALKAQAVAARTYALKKGLDERLTTDSTKDQAWLSKKELLIRWGVINYFLNWFKISSAVEETEGIVAMYNDELIEALYHSSAGDYTASAKEVWGNDIPYLQSVKSDYERDSPYYQFEDNYSQNQFCYRLGCESKLQSVEIIKRSRSGRVLKLKVSDKLFSGREFRRRLGLKSTKFKIILGSSIKIITSGYGHGVGMSQYGANGMAKRGFDFEEILKHYYLDIHLNIFW